MLSEYAHEQTRIVDRELRELAHARPRYERPAIERRSRIRAALRGIALRPEKATPGAGGRPAGVVIRPATRDEVDADVVAALPLQEPYVLTDLRRPTGDLVQLLELRSEQLRAAQLEKVA